VVRRFGRGLFDLYFKPYTEKVWGIPCHQIAADWAAQRIGVPGLSQAAFRALVPWRTPPATAVAEFYYPRHGYGEISDRLTAQVVGSGSEVLTGRAVTQVRFAGTCAQVDVTAADGGTTTLDCSRVISTIPVHELLRALSHDADVASVAANTTLAYRGLMLVFLALDRPWVSRDTWTYFPERSLLFGRCHEPRNWSAALVPGTDVTSLALEVFCSAGDAIWRTSDQTIVEQAVQQLAELGWIRPREVRASWVVREAHAYPVYTLDYQQQLATIRAVLGRWPQLSLLGRTGSFEYLNADGIVEACFALARSLGAGRDAVQPLTSSAGRWI
jgi:protoporphyrinogen oxidase